MRERERDREREMRRDKEQREGVGISDIVGKRYCSRNDKCLSIIIYTSPVDGSTGPTGVQWQK